MSSKCLMVSTEGGVRATKSVRSLHLQYKQRRLDKSGPYIQSASSHPDDILLKESES